MIKKVYMDVRARLSVVAAFQTLCEGYGISKDSEYAMRKFGVYEDVCERLGGKICLTCEHLGGIPYSECACACHSQKKVIQRGVF